MYQDDFFYQFERSAQYASMVVRVSLEAAKGFVKLSQFVARQHREKMLSDAEYEDFKLFTKMTDGDFSIYTVPLDLRGFTETEKVDLISRLDSMENLSKEDMVKALDSFTDAVNRYKDNIDSADVRELLSLVDSFKKNAESLYKVSDTVNNVKDDLRIDHFNRLESSLDEMKSEELKSFKESLELLKEKVNKLPAVNLSEQLERAKKELADYGINFSVIDKGSEEHPLFSLGVDNKDKDKFVSFFHNYQNKMMSGGQHRVEVVRAMTDNKASFVSMAEAYVDGFSKILENNNVNFAFAPDNNLSDGVKQLVIPNDELNNVSVLLTNYKNAMLNQKKTDIEYKILSPEEYDSTAIRKPDEVIKEARMDSNIDKMMKKYDEAEKSESLLQKQNAINSESKVMDSIESFECSEFLQNTDYRPVFIANSLVNNLDDSVLCEMKEKHPNEFLCRVPGTWGDGTKNSDPEQILFIPKENVFKNEENNSFIGFLPKNEEPMIVGGDGYSFKNYYKSFSEFQKKFTDESLFNIEPSSLKALDIEKDIEAVTSPNSELLELERMLLSK